MDGVIRCDGKSYTLEPRVMQLLVYLCDRAGQVISAEQLLGDVWKGTFYGDNPVHKCVALVRRALGDDASAPRYIETLRKRGYRLIAPVERGTEGRRRRIDDPMAQWARRCPYVGLAAFSSDQSALFCGRRQATEGLLDAMHRQRRAGRQFVLVLGPSGIGKTSLLRAGVVPRLIDSKVSPELRVARVLWVNLRDVRSGRTLTDLVEANSEFAPVGDAASDVAVLERLIVIDNLELLVHDVRWRDQRLAFDTDLRRLCGSPGIFVMAIARSDAYSGLVEALPSLLNLKSGDGQFDVPAITRGEIAEMIRRPARLAGLEFELDSETRLRLDDALCNAAAERPGSLPLLQVTLQMLFERRDGARLQFSAYDDIGGLDGAIARQAEAVFSRLAADAQASLASVLGKLVHVDAEGNLLGGRVVLRDTIESTAESALVDALIEARLLVSDHRSGAPVFALAHDAVIREWPRAQAWLRENKRLLSARARLAAAARHWHDGGRRPDLLLPAGAQLNEASEVGLRMADSLDPIEQRYLKCSGQRERRLRAAIASGVLALMLCAISASVLSILAQRANEIAEQRRIEGEQVVDFLLDDLANRLRDVGRLDLLNSVSVEATRYLDRARVPATADHALRRVRALRILTEVNAGRGELSAASDAMVTARELLDALEPEVARSMAYQFELGSVLYWQGYIALQRNDPEAAREAWEGYREAAERMLEAAPDDTTSRLEMSYALNNLGNLALRDQRDREAEDFFIRSIEIKRELYAQHPDRLDIGADLADSMSWWGSALEQRGRLDDALRQFTAQLSLLRAVSKQRPEDRLWDYRLTTALTQSATVQFALGQVPAAREALTESVDRLRTLVRADPSNQSWRRDLVVAATRLGWLEATVGRRDAASAAFGVADAALQDLLMARERPATWQTLELRLRLKRVLSETIDPEQITGVEQAASLVSFAEALGRRFPRDQEVQLDRALALNVLAHVTGERSHFEQALGVLQPWLYVDSTGLASARDVDTLALLALTLKGLGREGDAAHVRQQLDATGHQSPALIWLESTLHVGS